MKQLTQKLKSGDMQVLEVPVPGLQQGCVLVRSHYSLISAGTEGSTVSTARKGLIGKAKERPQQVKLVIDTLRSQGPVQTYRAVMKKLDAFSPLGYSGVGKIIEVGRRKAEGGRYKEGDLVACGGLTANHAEVVSRPLESSPRIREEKDTKRERSYPFSRIKKSVEALPVCTVR